MRLLPAILLLLPLSALAQTQVPNVFEDGTPASAAEVNENFQYVLENASGGCSASQQDNSVLIECADGTSGVLAGAGTIVVIPSGGLGETLDYSEISTGDFYWEDGNGVLLAEYIGYPPGSSPWTTDMVDANGKRMKFFQDDSQQLVRAAGRNWPLYYAELDCQGSPLSRWPSTWVVMLDGQYMVKSGQSLDGETLIKSSRYSDRYDVVIDDYTVQPCSNLDNPYPEGGDFIAPYEPPAEWLNAVYPLTLTQKP